MLSRNSAVRHVIWLLSGLVVLFVFIWQAPAFYSVQGLANYLPLHMFAETFSIVISMMVFGVAWNVYSKERPGNIVILACALLAVGLIDFAHMLSFKGMPDFITPSGPEKAINLWLSARLIAALALLAVAVRPWQPSHNPHIRYYLLAVSLAVAGLVIWLGLAYPQAWPHTFIEGKGLTPFKIGAEYTIIAILCVPAVLFYLQSRQKHTYDIASLFAATVITILSELSFTLYSDVADIFNLLGHFYKIVAYGFIYRAVFKEGVHEPFRRLDAELAENRRIAEQLQGSASERLQLAAIVEFSSDAIIGKTPDGIVTSWNKGAEKIFGYAADEIIGKHISTLALPDQHAEMQQLLEKICAGETVVNYESERIRKDGTQFYVSLTHSPIRDAAGKVSGISTIAYDVTERKRMEQERIENLRYFESMDKINRAMQGAEDIERMMGNVLDVVLSVFDCDRVGLVHPCNPQVETWQIVMERAKTGYGTETGGGPLPMTDIRAESMQRVLEANGPVRFGPDGDYPVSPKAIESFSIRSFMAIAVYPRTGEPWEFAIHQCSRTRTWTVQEMKLFEEIGRRLADGLNIMLVNRNLQESEQRYRMVFENSPVSIWEEDFSGVKALLDGLRQQGVADIETWFEQHPEMLQQCAQEAKVVDVNAAALVMFGAESKEKLQGGLADTFTPESFDTFREELVHLWNGGTGMSHDTAVHTLRGELLNVTVYFAVCPGYEKTLGKIIVSIVDITERKNAETATFEAQQIFRTLVENSPDIITRYDRDCRRTYVNPTYLKVAQMPQQDLLGSAPAKLSPLPADSAQILQKMLRNVLDNGISEEVDVVWPKSDNIDHWYNVFAYPEFDREGKVISVMTVSRDITERKEAEKERRVSAEKLEQVLLQIIEAIVATVEARDPYTAGHERRVAILAGAIAREMGLPDETVHGITLAASIHDLGKIRVPAEILSKPGKLNSIEFELVKVHAQTGYDIIKEISFSQPIAQIVLQHHERLDGTGYPQGLKDEQILPEAKILAVADVVEAMSSHRPYRPGLGVDAALEEIIRHRGKLYDPAVVDSCVALFREKGFSLEI